MLAGEQINIIHVFGNDIMCTFNYASFIMSHVCDSKIIVKCKLCIKACVSNLDSFLFGVGTLIK